MPVMPCKKHLIVETGLGFGRISLNCLTLNSNFILSLASVTVLSFQKRVYCKMSNIIAVLGATGSQGGGVVRALLKNGKFAVRAVTRNVNSDKAKELAKICSEVVQADADDVVSLKKAFQGAYGAFFLTNYWEHAGDVEHEIQQTKNLADAAAAAGLKHVVISTLEDTRKIVKEGTMPILFGKYTVPEFDGKGEVLPYVFKTVPTTALLVCGFHDNFLTFKDLLGPKPEADGTFSITYSLGHVGIPLVATKDIGKMAAKAFENPSCIGQTIAAVGDVISFDDVAKLFTKHFGKTVVYNAMEPQDFAKLPFPGADDLAAIFQYWRDYNTEYCALRSLEAARKFLPDVLTLEQWILENKATFSAHFGVSA